MTIDVGILGLGHIGYFHIKAILDLPQYRLKAACDLNPELNALVPDEVAFYQASDDFLADDSYDTVIIATPNTTHYQLGSAALNARKHIIMEKPATSSIQELISLEELSKDKGLHIYYAFHAAKAFEVAWFRDYYNLEENRTTLGPITGFSSIFYDPYFEDGRVKKEALSLENPWIDSGVNAISVLSEIMEPKVFSPFAVSKTRLSDTSPPLQALVHLSYPIQENGCAGIGTINTNWSLGINKKKTYLFFAFSGNCIELDHSNQKVKLRSFDNQSNVLQSFEDCGDRLFNHYIGVFSDYLECLENKSFNNERALRIHTLLFQADQWVPNL